MAWNRIVFIYSVQRGPAMDSKPWTVYGESHLAGRSTWFAVLAVMLGTLFGTVSKVASVRGLR